MQIGCKVMKTKYWNDSGFYQIQNIKEKVDEAASSKLKINENQVSKERLVKKESQSLNIWLWVGIAILGLCTIGRLTNSRWQNKK